MQRLLQFFETPNPMLVKEVRQGVQSLGFVIAFLLIHTGMILFLCFGLAASSGSNSDLNGINSMFWSLTGLALLGLIPLTGMNALYGELREGRVDLLRLTRLSARRIVQGKWIALNAQSLLLATSLVPYMVVRYFVGSVNFVQDVLLLLMMLGISAIFSAITVSCSVIQHVALRVLLFLFALYLLLTGLAGFLFSMSFGGSFGPTISEWLLGLLMLFCLGLPLALFCAEFAAARLAPPAENNETPMRLLAIGVCIFASIVAFVFQPDDELVTIMLFATVPLAFVSSWYAVVHPPKTIPIIQKPFLRLGIFGRLLGRYFLYPGWAHALLYIVLIWPLALLPFYPELAHSDFEEFMVTIFGSVACFLFPLAIIKCLPFKPRSGNLIFILSHLGMVFYCITVGIISVSVRDDSIMVLWAFTPLSSLVGLDLNESLFFEMAIISNTVYIALSLLVLLVRARPALAMAASLEKVAATLQNLKAPEVADRLKDWERRSAASSPAAAKSPGEAPPIL